MKGVVEKRVNIVLTPSFDEFLCRYERVHV